MLTPTLLIVADRGGLRAYKVEPNPTRPPSVHLLDSFEAEETHGRYQDKVTDQAGRNFGSNDVARHMGGSDERLPLDAENLRRACRHIADRIGELVGREKPEAWLLAIPAQIEKLVLEHLDADARKHLAATAHANLLHTEPNKLLGHFPGLQPA